MVALLLFTVAIGAWQAQKVAGSVDWRRPLPPVRSRAQCPNRTARELCKLPFCSLGLSSEPARMATLVFRQDI